MPSPDSNPKASPAAEMPDDGRQTTLPPTTTRLPEEARRRPADRPRRSPLASLFLRDRDQIVVAVLVAVALVLLGLYCLRMSGWGSEPIEIDRLPQRTFDYRIDINTAPWVELAQLPQIGETLARRIVEYRNAHGPFRSIDELDDVPGIGPIKLEAIRPYLLEPPQPALSSTRGEATEEAPPGDSL